MSRFPVSDHCDGKLFFTPGAPPLHKFSDVLRWRFSRRVPDWAPHAVIPQLPPPPPSLDSTEAHVTWVGHSTFLLQLSGLTLLTDPVFSECVGLFGRIGPRRVHAPGVRLESLPRIDAILLSHDHYDHCDLPSLKRLERAHQPVVIAPLGFKKLLRRAGITRLIELDWWQSHILETAASPASLSAPPSASVTLTPAQHWSNRLTGPRCGRLWGGFLVEKSGRRFFFAGDTGYHAHFFKDIATRLGPPDLALLPIGAYEPRWFMRDQHVNPAEAVQIHQDLQARRSIGMHWGTFQLTDEPRLAPVVALRDSVQRAGLGEDSFNVMEPGQTVSV